MIDNDDSANDKGWQCMMSNRDGDKSGDDCGCFCNESDGGDYDW